MNLHEQNRRIQRCRRRVSCQHSTAHDPTIVARSWTVPQSLRAKLRDTNGRQWVKTPTIPKRLPSHLLDRAPCPFLHRRRYGEHQEVEWPLPIAVLIAPASKNQVVNSSKYRIYKFISKELVKPYAYVLKSNPT